MTLHPLINKPAPQFSIPDANGQTFQFPPEECGQHVRRPIALFFYPKSGTYGCIREACQFRDALVDNEIFKQTNVRVIGISSDPVPAQKQFVESQNLTYPILSDELHVAHEAFQVGKSFLGLRDSRTTFVIDEYGIVRDSLSTTLSYGAHVTFVNEALERLAGEKERRSSTRFPSDSTAGEADQDPAGPENPILDKLGRVAYGVGA